MGVFVCPVLFANVAMTADEQVPPRAVSAPILSQDQIRIDKRARAGDEHEYGIAAGRSPNVLETAFEGLKTQQGPLSLVAIAIPGRNPSRHDPV